MIDEPEQTSLTKLAVEVAVAFLNRSAISPDQVKQLIIDIRTALQMPLDNLSERPAVNGQAHAGGKTNEVSQPLASNPSTSAPTPAVPIAASVTDEYIYSLEDGQPYRSLRRHLAARHGMTPDDYRRKWGLPDDYPMVAPSYARERSEVAKRIGLGRVAPAAQKSKARL